MGLEFFDATGELVKSGSRTVKCVTGYNLAGMMLQSEGTLGIISQAVLKLVPPPQASKALMAVFDDMQKAAEAVAGIIAAHVVPCTLEFLDNNTIVRVDDYTKAGLPRDAAMSELLKQKVRLRITDDSGNVLVQNAKSAVAPGEMESMTLSPEVLTELMARGTAEITVSLEVREG